MGSGEIGGRASNPGTPGSSRDVIGVSDHVLDAVARALHWTTERVHPTVSPGATAAARGRYRWHLNPALRHLLDAGSPDPAYLLDRRREYLGFTTPTPPTVTIAPTTPPPAIS